MLQKNNKNLCSVRETQNNAAVVQPGAEIQI